MHTTPHPVPLAAHALLAQCADFVQRMTDDAYTADSNVLPGGTAGKHVRHTIDHFAAIVSAHDEGMPIDYDHRLRNVPMESLRAEALRVIEHVQARIAAQSPASMKATVRVRVMLAADGTETELYSTLARELAFATHHAIHHLAMMKAIAAEFGIHCPESFGKAPSTLHHESRLDTSMPHPLMPSS
jgi:hypothetical protein